MELQNATSLNLVFDDPNNEFGPFRTQIEENIQFAWNQWDVFIDADPNASIELTVLPSNDTGSTVASASSPFINGAAHGVVGTELINGVDNNGSSSDGSIEISIDFLSEFHYNLDSTASGDKINFGDVITHELGHVLGYSSSIPDLLQTAYGSLVDEVDGTFIGEHATAVNGGPVSLQGGSLSHLDRSSFPSSIMSPVALRGGNLDISRLELAILADIGLPINIDFSDETLPMVTVEEITTDEDKNIANITVNLNKNSVKPVSIDYTTIDFGSATEGEDFVVTSGTLIFPAGIRTQTIDVPIIDDLFRENLEFFKISLSNPVNTFFSDSNDYFIGIADDDEGLPSIDDNIVNIQRGVVSSASGDDTYILSSAVVDSNARITLSDNQGTNKIQLFEGLGIASSIVATDTVLLALSNGAEITLLGASSFTFETGGNPLAGTFGVTNNYTSFVSNVLGSSVPESNTPNNGSAITINADGSITLGATDNFPNDGAVSTDSDLLIVQRGVVSSASGDDTYVLSSSTVNPNARITISDNQGDNRIQLFEGLDIASSIVATDTALLTLSNGAEITLLGASLFSYETGGNPLAGEIGAINSYSDFVSNILGSSVPGTGSAPNNGGSVTIGTNESSNNIDDQDGGIELIQGNSLIDIVV